MDGFGFSQMENNTKLVCVCWMYATLPPFYWAWMGFFMWSEFGIKFNKFHLLFHWNCVWFCLVQCFAARTHKPHSIRTDWFAMHSKYLRGTKFSTTFCTSEKQFQIPINLTRSSAQFQFLALFWKTAGANAERVLGAIERNGGGGHKSQ